MTINSMAKNLSNYHINLIANLFSGLTKLKGLFFYQKLDLLYLKAQCTTLSRFKTCLYQGICTFSVLKKIALLMKICRTR